MVAEEPKHPELIAWYWEHVVSRGITALRTIIECGVKTGIRPHRDYGRGLWTGTPERLD